MKLTIEKADLVSALARIVAVAPARGTIAILANVALKADKSGLTLRCSNLDMDARVTVKCDVVTPGETTVNAARLFEIARNVPVGATITMDLGDDPRMKVSSGRSRFLMPVIAVADFPQLEKTKYPVKVAVSAPVLADALRRVAWAQSVDAMRHYLNGVHVIVDAQCVHLETANGHVCALTEFEAETTGEAKIIIPTPTVTIIQRLLDSGAEGVEIGISETRISAVIDGVTLSSKLVEGSFPEVARLVPTDLPARLTVDGDALSEAIKRVCGASDDKIPAVTLTLSTCLVAVSSRGSDGEEAHDEVECDYDGADIKVTVTTDYATKCIAALNTDALNIALSDDGIRMVWDGGDVSKGLLMGRRG